MGGLVYDRGTLWVSCPETSEVVRLDPNSAGSMLGPGAFRIAVEGQPGYLEFDGRYVYAADQRTLAVPFVTRLVPGTGMEATVGDRLEFSRTGAILKLRFDGLHLWALLRNPQAGGNSSWLFKF